MKLAVRIESPPFTESWATAGRKEIIDYVMLSWVESTQRDYLIALGVPFLFIGGSYNPRHPRPVMVVIDIPKVHIGIAKVVCGEHNDKVLPKSFFDIRIDKVRKEISIDAYLEKMCSNDRELHIYNVNKY